ncbi:hypothetical protein SAMN05660297_00848 [Natronincola peptidivorans]|uniref:Uncharacterized protein n=1 Tax=Natronincola peptidivorans TaxID=426128 RepID=A0A1I0A3U1_9FIRM|nr:hypothetical protein [Natronincola peptidivorans]SES88339.1 hypothetical protein SAMN05660297_00848 [Natronincola peptidivorans]
MSEGVKGTGIFGDVFGTNSSILFFFLLLVIIFCNCPLFRESGDSLLFFLLILVVLFTGGRICGF